ncbi:hypothetical protein R1flu_026597 [Riccia fluitans]|uniref:TauD/TfdA-like domain-containing protein n=1 Tax=Riccia fluitans TaxID=41844 RepID=A0ABD1XH01_9MARC
MVSLCSDVIIRGISLHSSGSTSSSHPAAGVSLGRFQRIQQLRSERCRASSFVRGLSVLGSSSSYSSLITSAQLFATSAKLRKIRREKISCSAMGIQVVERDQEIQSESETQRSWFLDISIPPETVAGFKEDYEAEAKTWAPDLGTTMDFYRLEEFIASAHMLARKWLPRDVVRKLETFYHDPRQPSVMVIRGLPIDEDMPPTTYDGVKTKVGKYMSEAWLLGIGRIVGQPFNFKLPPQMVTAAGGGMELIVREILPRREKEQNASNYGSSVILEMHRDFFTCAPECAVDVLIFMGLRGDPRKIGKTLVADYYEIYNRLSPDDIQILREQSLTWQFGPTAESGFTHPVIFGTEENPEFYIFEEEVLSSPVEDRVKGSAEAMAAYRRLKDVAREVAVEHGGVDVERGVVLLLNQRRVSHGRTSFEAKYDGNDRWVQKILVNQGQIWQPYGPVPWPERHITYRTVKHGP